MTRPRVWVLLVVLAMPLVGRAQSPVILAAPSDPAVSDGVRPLLNICSLEQGSAVSGEKPVDVTFRPAADGVPLAKVDVLIDGVAKIMFDLKPEDRNVSYNWNTRDFTDGKHLIEAVLTDRDGRSRSYQTFVYVRNTATPAPVGSRLEVIDKGGAPEGVFSTEALIRVVPDPTVGAQWVIIYVNDKMKAMMNRPPYQETIKPNAATNNAPIIVRATIVRPDGNREELGPIETHYDPTVTRATLPTPTAPLPTTPKTVPNAAVAPGMPGVARPDVVPRDTVPTATVSPVVQPLGGVEGSGGFTLGSPDIRVMGAGSAVPMPPLSGGPLRPTYTGPLPPAIERPLPPTRVSVGGVMVDLAPVGLSEVSLPGAPVLAPWALPLTPGLPSAEPRSEATRTTVAGGGQLPVTAPPVRPVLGPAVSGTGPALPATTPRISPNVTAGAAGGVPTVLAGPGLPGTAPATSGSSPRLPGAGLRTVTGGHPMAAAVSTGASRSVVPTRLAPPAEGSSAGEQTPHVSLPSGTRVERAVSRPAVGPAVAKVHVVAKGDTLTAISRRFGVSIEDLRRLNRLTPKSPLQAGQRLVVPRGDLSINGVTVHTDVAPLQHRTGVATSPIRFIVEGLGGSVSWIGPTQTVTANAGKRGILTITVGSREATLGNERILMDLAAYLEGDRTMVPARFISEAFDVTIDMDPDSGNIVIRSND